MESNKLILQDVKGIGDVLEGEKREKDFKLDSRIIDEITGLIKNHPNLNKTEIAESVGKMYEVVFKPNIQEGINDGQFLWNGINAQVRDANTKKYVGFVELKEVDLQKAMEKSNVSPQIISNASKVLCNISGQMQLAEISKKLDVISNKLNDIIENERDKINSKLTGTLKTLDKALEVTSESNVFKLSRINSCINELQELTDYFENKLNKNFHKEVNAKFIDSLKQSFKLNSSKSIDEVFYKKTEDWLEDCKYFLQAYLLAYLALAKCYEIVDGNNARDRELLECKVKYEHYKSFLAQRIVYILKVSSISIEDSKSLDKVISKVGSLEKHNLLKSSLMKLDRTINDNDININITKSTNPVEVIYTIDKEKLIGGL